MALEATTAASAAARAAAAAARAAGFIEASATLIAGAEACAAACGILRNARAERNASPRRLRDSIDQILNRGGQSFSQRAERLR